ncbi:2-dehydropantoate 2-reductase [Luteococcus sp. Sow4_B9]|uniref:2-dehydropantoate 2-reductase n=1 Tax=Luteococcus sp. Sow4_B9 TaxID=3438792 RepID=UPI003F98F7DB
MRIAVIGTGALGGYFGGLLARDGHEVVFTARGEHLRALQGDGLRITGQTSLAMPIDVTDDATTIPPVELVLLAVKATQLDDVLPTLAGMIGPGTAVITLQNGIEAPQQVADVLGQEHVLPGIVRVYTRIAAPGVIDHMGGPGSITFGEWDNAASERAGRIREAFQHAGIVSEAQADIWQDLWHKVMFVVPTGMLGALAGVELGAQRTTLRQGLTALMAEVAQVGTAHGIDLDGAVEQTLAFAHRMPAEATTSMHRDLDEGRPGELDPLVGGIRRLGAAVGVPTPVFDLVHEVLLQRLQ